ncbi:MAG: ABC transporter permease [Desulfovibrionaceae bacterium]
MPDSHSHTAPPASHAEIARQIVLPWGKSFEIALKNLRVRFFRSILTVASLVLAVTFLAYILISTDVAQGSLNAGGAQAAESLVRAGYDVNDAGTLVSASAKQRWIVILSLLVCTVGIVNAQLMSVIERFREIGIMKCLGALDRIVLRLFLLEAAMQGLAGALIGALLGCCIALLGGWARFGREALAAMDAGGLAGSLGLALGAGLALSLAGVAYPAVVAARMRPIMAMRAEY